MLHFAQEDVDDAELERLRGLYGSFTDAVRDLVDATIRTEVDEDTLRAVQGEIEAATARLRTKQLDGPYGVRVTPTGKSMAWGNAAVGLRNAAAPPMVINHDGKGSSWAQVDLGAAYEGPPGLVHGGVAALLLDHILGETGSFGRRTNLTGTIEIKFLRATPLGRLRVEARIDRDEQYKTFVVGSISDAEGVTVEARGVFIVPKWARGKGNLWGSEQ
ncbi:PaaI family thioesterase [Gordonia rubripertincta]|uniref:PaaI family thioesterase n=1 Tax=Gordonia rubripertincta TaxID=36822 RepID=A0ABT4MR58_GORRU|nr:PaaI family thioesterase [Gordonia rubripertincta]MCZ4549467.1 PaaI family thioesterase [Gordonia rubripertincta]